MLSSRFTTIIKRLLSSSSSSSPSSSSSSSIRNNVLSMYRRMLILCRSLPEPQRSENISKIRNEFKTGSEIMDTEKIQELIKKANSTMGYLKIITPRSSRRKEDVQQGITKIVYGTGDDKMGTKAVTNWHGGNMDPDSVKRHYQGLKRAGFRNNTDAKGIF